MKEERNRYIIIIKNQKGYDEYDTGIWQSDNLEMLNLPEKEFNELFFNVFMPINKKCGLLIDDFEAELIETKNIPIAKKSWKIKDTLKACFIKPFVNVIKMDTRLD
ncbi:MAG: hypothetical protein IJH61_07935 [Eubacteriaceae bacterium]|nr:hypothetical protein [Eubacteriaceae bacterium]